MADSKFQRRPWISPMENYSRQIRLLRLPRQSRQPGKNVRIELELQTYYLEKAPEYHALSYTWGGPFMEEPSEDYKDLVVDPKKWIERKGEFANSPAGPYKVICNGEEVEVTRNLWEGLQYIIPQFTGCLLWNDALCIDQKNKEEITEQIKVMGEIYLKAVNVIIWLGVDDKRTIWPFFFQSIYKYIRDFSVWSKHSENIEELWFCLFGDQVTEVTLELYRVAGLFFARAWWWRKWTYQEFVLARSDIFLCGPYRLEPLTILDLIKDIGFGYEFGKTVHDKMERTLSSLYNMRALLKESETKPQALLELLQQQQGCCQSAHLIKHLLIHTCARSTTNYEDTFWSIVGLYRTMAQRLGLPESEIIQEVQRSKSDALVTVSKHLHRDLPGLDLLRLAKYDEKDLKRPSWTPDFNDTLFYIQDTFEHDLSDHVYKNRDFKYPRQFRLLENPGQENSVLEGMGLRGIKMGTIVLNTLIPSPSMEPGEEGKLIDVQRLLALFRFSQELPQKYRERRDMIGEVLRIFKVGESCTSDLIEAWFDTTLILALRETKKQAPGHLFAQTTSSEETLLRSISERPRIRSIEGMDDDKLYFAQGSIKMRFFRGNKYLIRTNNDLIGTTLATCGKDDEVWGLEGGVSSFILRPTSQLGQYYLIGEVCIDGTKQSDFICRGGKDLEWQEIWLV